MSDGKKPWLKNQIHRVLAGYAVIVGGVIALSQVVVFLEPFLIRVVEGILLIAVIWIAIAAVRWGRSRW